MSERKPSLSLPSLPERPTTATEHRALGWLAFGALAVVGWLVAPIGVGLLLGTLTAFALQPLHRRILDRYPRHPAFAALASTLVAVGTLGTSLGIIGYVIVDKVLTGLQDVVLYLRTRGIEDLAGSPRLARSLARWGVTRQQIAGRVEHLLDLVTSQVTESLTTVVGAVLATLLALLFLVVTTYYVLQEWAPLVLRVERLLPLNPRHTRALLAEFREVGRSALLGTVATGIAQGVLAGIGYALAGVDQPVFWGVLTAIASLLPAIGTMLVWLPIGLVLIAQGHIVAGLAELLWSLGTVIGFCDYVLRPILVGRQSKMHPLLVLVSLLGGVEVMGGIGVILGPVLMALFVAVLRIYERERDLPSG